MKISYKKIYRALAVGTKLPRKIKKNYLGLRMSKTKLKKLLNSVEVIYYGSEITPEIKPYTFCPNCGCKLMLGRGNLCEYPEHYETFFCVKCSFLVGIIDNNYFEHALQHKDNNYIL
jgi:hypothetical protein